MSLVSFEKSMCVKSVSHFSHVWFFVIPWIVAHQAPLSMGFSRQECWSELSFPPLGDLPDQGSNPISLFLKKIIYFNWRLITLQYCSGFCHTLTWISYGCTCVPHPEPLFHFPPHPIPFLKPIPYSIIDFMGSQLLSLSEPEVTKYTKWNHDTLFWLCTLWVVYTEAYNLFST